MSWEPAHPVGFSPCGIAFGALRHCYSAPCKFFADDDGASNRINWYFVDDDTPVYEGLNVFWPRSDVPLNDATSVFEKEGLGRSVRLHNDGVDRYGFPGTLPHGDPDDYAGISPRSKYFHDVVVPVSTCVNVKLGKFGTRFGLRPVPPTRIGTIMPAGLIAGFFDFEERRHLHRGIFGIVLGMKARVPGEIELVFQMGLVGGFLPIDRFAMGAVMKLGLQGGLVAGNVNFAFSRLQIGLVGSVVAMNPLAMGGVFKIGLLAGFNVGNMADSFASLQVGLLAGFSTYTLTSAENHATFGLRLGMRLRLHDMNCTEAVTLILGNTYTFEISTLASVWFVYDLIGETDVTCDFNVLAGDPAHCTLGQKSACTSFGVGDADDGTSFTLEIFPSGFPQIYVKVNGNTSDGVASIVVNAS